MTTPDRPGAVDQGPSGPAVADGASSGPGTAPGRPGTSAALRGASMGALVMLIIQFALGVGVSLYISPAKGGVSEAFSNGPLLAIHAVLGLLLILAAISHLVRAIRSKRAVILGASVLGLVSILAAAFSGASFLSDQANGASLGMALATAVAMFCYAVCLRVP